MALPLPDEKYKKTGKHELFKLLVTILTFFLLFNFGIFVYLKLHPLNWGHSVIAHKWEMLTSLTHGLDWLFLGDSSGNQGVSPKRFGDGQIEGINLATYGGLGIVGDALMLDYYLKHHDPPENVVMIHVYDVWYRDLDLMAFSHVPLTAKALRNLKASNIDFYLTMARYWVYQILPIVVQGNTVGKHLLSAKKERISLNFDTYGFMSWNDNDSILTEQNLKNHLQFLRSNDFKVSEINKKSLDYIDQLAKRYNFNVYIFNSPVYSKLGRTAIFEHYYAELNNWMLTRVSKSKRLKWMSAQPLLFDSQYLAGVDHLTREGAMLYTDSLYRKIVKPIPFE